MSPESIVIREERPDGPTRRRVYEPAAVGYVVTIELWRLAAEGWHTTGTEQLETVAIDRPEER